MTSLNNALEENESELLLPSVSKNEQRVPILNSDSPQSQSNIVCLASSPSSTGSQLNCRICLMPVESQHIKNYCLCSGSIGIYHKNCQLKWLVLSNKEECEVCNYKFNFKKEYGINYNLICSISLTLGIIGLIVGLIFYTIKGQIILILCLFSSLAILVCVNILKTGDLYKLKNIDLLELELEEIQHELQHYNSEIDLNV